MNKSFAYLALVTALVLPAVSLAADFRTGEQPAVASGERATGDVYLIGGSATSIGSVTGDLVAGGGNVILSGDVGADVLATGGNVTILSNVGDDVRAGGGNITIQGRVGGDVVVGGGQVNIGGPGVAGDVVVGGGTVRLDAPVGGKVKIVGGDIVINSQVRGNVTIEANKVTLGPSAVISGNLTYTANQELIKQGAAEVVGTVKFTQREQKTLPAGLIFGLISAWLLGKFLMLFVCALIFGLIFRRYSREVVAKALERPLVELGRGLLTMIVLPVVSVLLLVTVLGIPFGVIGLLSIPILMLIAWIVTPILVGSYLYGYLSKGNREVTWKSILLGVFVMELLSFVPLLGWLVKCVATLITIGVIVAIKWRVVREWR